MTTKITKISSGDLKSSDVPDGDSSWHEISLFSHTFDTSEYNPYSIQESDFKSVNNNASVPYLRARLYAEQRRWNHYGRPVDGDAIIGIKKILEILKNKIR